MESKKVINMRREMFLYFVSIMITVMIKLLIATMTIAVKSLIWSFEVFSDSKLEVFGALWGLFFDIFLTFLMNQKYIFY